MSNRPSSATEARGRWTDRLSRTPSAKPAGSIVDAVEPRIRELLRAYPRMPATVIAERIGWTHSIRVLRLGWPSCARPICRRTRPRAPATRRARSRSATCGSRRSPCRSDIGQARRPTQLPVLTMVTGYSRWLSALLIPTRTAADLFAGWWQLIAGLGAVPRVLVWDGEGAIGRWRGGRVELTAECQAFRGTLAAKVLVCKPADPEAKGLIERAHDYLERSFLPGRRFTGPQRLQHPAAAVADPGQRPPPARVGLRADRPDHRRPPGDARPAAGRARDGVAGGAAAAA